MPLFKSFRSKSSLKSSGASIMSENDQSTDFGPRSPSSNTLASRKGAKGGVSDYGGSVGRVGKHGIGGSDGAPLPSSPSAASVRTSHSTAALKQQQPNLMEVVQPSNGNGTASVGGGGNSVHTSPVRPSGPRPSELFAGKGVQWDSVKLAGPGSSPAVQNRAAHSNTEDLQNFLKQRRQWKPTFVTEESAPRTHATTDLSKLSFLSQENQSNRSGLMSFDELDKSHQRKQQLLSDNPLGANLWEEAETSKAGEARAAAAAAASSRAAPSVAGGGAKTLGSMDPPPVKRSGSGFYKRKSVNKQQSSSNVAATIPGAAPPLPQSSSVHAIGASAPVGPANGGTAKQQNQPTATKVIAPDRNDAAPPNRSSSSSSPPTAAAAVRPSMDTSAGFATPAADSPPVPTQDLENNVSTAQHQNTPAHGTNPVPDEPLTPRANKAHPIDQGTPVSAA